MYVEYGLRKDGKDYWEGFSLEVLEPYCAREGYDLIFRRVSETHLVVPV